MQISYPELTTFQTFT